MTAKTDFHNIATKDVLALAIQGVAAKFMYEQATPETTSVIVETLDSVAEEFVARGAIWSYKSNCYLQADQIVLEITFAETPSDALRPTKVEVKLCCG